ncbi:hypothetical protein ACMHYB_45045 [Sorangium sp. So ce1128]
MQPSKSSLDRLPKQLSGEWEAQRESFEKTVRAGDIVPVEAVTVAVSLDGVLVPMRDGGREEKRARTAAEGRPASGPAGYQEVGCGTVSFYDEAGGRLSTVKIGRMPEFKKSTLKKILTEKLGAALAQRPELKLVTVADGANDNWDFLHGALPPSVEVIDFYHAAEHLNVALGAAYGEGTVKCRAQFDKLRLVLLEDPDGVEKIIRSLVHLTKQHPGSRRIGTELAYFRKHRRRMRYATWRAAFLPIGSGVVEAACKTLAAQRMKRSGMRWRHEGGQAILTFRGLIQSERFDGAWALLAATYKTEVTLFENVIALSDCRRQSRCQYGSYTHGASASDRALRSHKSLRRRTKTPLRNASVAAIGRGPSSCAAHVRSMRSAARDANGGCACFPRSPTQRWCAASSII